MITLVIDTATERGTVAILTPEKTLAQHDLPVGLQQSKYLMPAIEKMLQDIDMKPADLDFITVGNGPGSYTGIRVGIAAAQGLSLGTNIPLITVSTLKALTPPHKFEGSFAAILDARIAGAYVITGTKAGPNISYNTEPAVVALEDLHSALEGIELVVTTSKEKLEKRLNDLHNSASWPWHETTPNPTALAHEAFKKFHANQEHPLQVLYLRKTQAETEREALRSPC